MTWHCIVLGWGVPLGVWFAIKVVEVYVGRRKGAVAQGSREAEPQLIQQVPRRTRRLLAAGLSSRPGFYSPEPERVLPKPEQPERISNKDTRRNTPS